MYEVPQYIVFLLWIKGNIFVLIIDTPLLCSWCILCCSWTNLWKLIIFHAQECILWRSVWKLQFSCHSKFCHVLKFYLILSCGASITKDIFSQTCTTVSRFGHILRHAVIMSHHYHLRNAWILKEISPCFLSSLLDKRHVHGSQRC